MKRREVIQSLGLVSSHLLFPSILSGFMMSCSKLEKQVYTPVFFNLQEFEIIREIVDIILPATNTKSASQVKTHQFLDEVFAKCMTSAQQSLIKEGLSKLIPALTSCENKKELLIDIDLKAYNNDERSAYFKTIKQYTLISFFTSQEGTTKASNYLQFPGDYKGDIPLKETTLNYGKTSLHFNL